MDGQLSALSALWAVTEVLPDASEMATGQGRGNPMSTDTFTTPSIKPSETQSIAHGQLGSPTPSELIVQGPLVR
jgi:hypothetical protein